MKIVRFFKLEIIKEIMIKWSNMPKMFSNMMLKAIFRNGQFGGLFERMTFLKHHHCLLESVSLTITIIIIHMVTILLTIMVTITNNITIKIV